MYGVQTAIGSPVAMPRGVYSAGVMGGENTGGERVDRSDDSVPALTRSDRDAQTRIEPKPHAAATTRGAPPITDAPLKIGRYTVLRRLGQGGMGVVYAAHDDELDRRVAIKLLLSRPEEGSMGRARLQREAQALAKLSHPNVVQVYETGSHDDQVYLVMEYIEGATLRDWYRVAEPSWREIVDMFIETGKGLAEAHRAGLIHRDFKPTNVLVGDDGRPRILDFGLARASVLPSNNSPVPRSAPVSSALLLKSGSVSLSTELTQAGTLLGTPAYMSPEQLFLVETDARCDIYAFAVSLWEALYGARPYEAKSVNGLRSQVSDGPPALPKGSVPSAVGRALLRGLAFDRDDRYPTMELFLENLAAAVNFRRNVAIAGSLLLALVTLIATTFALVQEDGESPAQRCAGAGVLDDVWSPAIAESVARAIDELGVSYGAATWANVQPRIEAYSSALSVAMVEACITREGHHGALPPAVSEQAACLGRRRQELHAVTEQFQNPDAKTLVNAVASVSGLAALERCDDLEYLAGEALRRRNSGFTSDAQNPEWTAIEALLVKARVAERGEQFERGEALASEALAAAKAIQARPLRAAAHLRLGSLAELRGMYKESGDHLRAALLEAEAVGDDRLALEAALEFLQLDGVVNSDASAGRSWSLLAEAKIGRIHGEPKYRIELDLRRGIVGLETGDRASAEAAINAAVALASEHRKAYPSLYVSALNILSAVEKARGDLATSEQTLRRALREHRVTSGAGHPYQAMLIYNIGAVQLLRNELQAARASFAESLAAREAAYGPDHPEVAQSLNGLAAALLDLGDPKAAIPLIQRSLAIDETTRGMEHAELIFPLNNLADALEAEGRFTEAETHLVRALSILDKRDLMETSQAVLLLTGLANLDLDLERFDAGLERLDKAFVIGRKVMGETHPSLADIHHKRALLLLAKGEHEVAETSLDAALAQVAGNSDYIGTQTKIKLTKADLMWRHKRRRPAAITLVKDAAETLRKSATDHPGLIRSLETWLASHPAK